MYIQCCNVLQYIEGLDAGRAQVGLWTYFWFPQLQKLLQLRGISTHSVAFDPQEPTNNIIHSSRVVGKDLCV